MPIDSPGQVPSLASEVALPVEVVTLSRLRTRDGDPVRVLCEKVDEALVASILKRLPGERPQLGIDAAPPEDLDPIEKIRIMDEYGRPLVEAGTSLLGPDGEEVRPAFWFDAARRSPLSIPGRLLGVADRVALVTAILKLSGFLKEDGSEGAAFHDGVGGGADGRLGAVAAGAGGGEDPVGSSA